MALAAATALSLSAGIVLAQDSSTPTLTPAMNQILQMSQAKVSDGTIITYIQNSGTIYGLNASQIVYLKQQGVSEPVITAMLNQRTVVAASAVQTAPPPNNSQAPAQPNAVAQPAVTYVQSAPPSSLYVVPDSQTYYYNTWAAPYYYYPYPYYYYPPVTIGFGWGWGWGGWGWHGGYGGGWRGGWHR